jgi:antitoxin component YwqK of YwqJK toxin-antitoxin module
MKNYFLLLSVILISTIIQAQKVEEKDGLYYCNDKLYTGLYEIKDNDEIKNMNILEGKLEGTTTIFYLSGQKKEQQSYKNGLFDGLWITWNENGQKLAEANYSEGNKHGKWFIWDEKGTLRFEMNYENNQRVGKWTMLDENGKLISEKVY